MAIREDTKVIHLRVPTAHLTELQKLATREERTVPYLIRRLIWAALRKKA